MITLGLGDYAITNNSKEQLMTHALGSCVALILYCSKEKKAAMAHIVLPHRGTKHDLKHKRAYFAEDIVSYMLDQFINTATCKKSNVVCTLIGGAVSNYSSDCFKVGERNVKYVKEVLDTYNINCNDTETLGHYSRTVSISVETGEISIKKQKMII